MTYDINKIFGSFESNGKTNHYVDEEVALGHLLIEGVCFTNHRPYADGFGNEPDKIRGETTVIFVLCNDIFAWGCADAEDLPQAEIGPLFKMWHADNVWGPAKWCAIRRNQKPQPPAVVLMKKDGAWDDVMEALGENTMDAETQAMLGAVTNGKNTESK